MTNEKNSKRRDFIKNTTLLGAAAAMAPQVLGAWSQNRYNPDKDGNNFTFLFQGDSITDGNRSRNNDWNHVMGHGYQYIIASKLWYDFPRKKFHFLNRGVSGNKVIDLKARWQQDTIELKPDLVSILIGVNDTSAFINGDKSFTAEQYESGYRSLLQQTRQQLPEVQFVLCEPFTLPVGKVKEKWEEYLSEVRKQQQAVKRLSEEFGAAYVPFQSAFDKALSVAPAEYWIWDGIHPMPAGHELMAKEWIKEVSRKWKFIKY